MNQITFKNPLDFNLKGSFLFDKWIFMAICKIENVEYVGIYEFHFHIESAYCSEKGGVCFEII